MVLFALLISTFIRCDGQDISQELARGGKVELTEGTCTIARTVRPVRPLVLVGAGVALTTVKTSTSPLELRLAARRSEVRALSLVYVGPTSLPVIGIRSSARFLLDDVHIEHFAQGVRIDAGALRAEPGNANGFRLRDVTIKDSQHSGIVVEGADTNGGRVDGLEIQSACRRAAKFTPVFGRCAGVHDSSFLGGLWSAVIVSFTLDRDTGVTHRAYWFEGASQHSVCIVCYREKNAGASVLARNTIAIGGLNNAWEGLGQVFDGTYARSLVLRNTQDVANIVELKLGEMTRAGTWMALVAAGIDRSRPLEIAADPARRTYQCSIAEQVEPIRIRQDGRVTIPWLDTAYPF